MECRSACGACCVAPSISSPIPGMPLGKPAGVRCLHLAVDLRCGLFGDPQRPAVCGSLKPGEEMCGTGEGARGREHALEFLRVLELATQPDADL
jgi:Fe-S-cluster containining protein